MQYAIVRRHSRAWWQRLLLVFLMPVIAAGCTASITTAEGERRSGRATSDDPAPAAVTQPLRPTVSADAPALPVLPTPQPSPTAYPIERFDTELPPAPIGFDALKSAPAEGPQPISLEVVEIGVAYAKVVAVGVNADQSFEVPPADQVGWYRFGPTPGANGSAVLAAHIAFNGVDGVFRYLVDVEVGATVRIGFDDGTVQSYRINEVTEYDKQQLPVSLWAHDGDPQLALITCGGTFNPELSSYESNIVAIAVPL